MGKGQQKANHAINLHYKEVSRMIRIGNCDGWDGDWDGMGWEVMVQKLGNGKR